jgi:hypothetical protein
MKIGPEGFDFAAADKTGQMFGVGADIGHRKAGARTGTVQAPRHIFILAA